MHEGHYSCLALGCKASAGCANDAMCNRHWGRLPHGLQAALIKNYLKGRKNGNFVRYNYFCRKAIRVIAKQEGNIIGLHHPIDARMR